MNHLSEQDRAALRGLDLDWSAAEAHAVASVTQGIAVRLVTGIEAQPADDANALAALVMDADYAQRVAAWLSEHAPQDVATVEPRPERRWGKPQAAISVRHRTVESSESSEEGAPHS